MALVVSRVPAWGGLAELSAKAGLGVVVFGVAAWVLDAAQIRGRAGQALKLLKVRMA
jgi:hypothetical protein